jgi:ABC-type dipeptide/oligopeptide/nickel transport system permease subunit
MSSQKDIERELYDSALVDGAKEIPQAIGMPNDPMIIAADVTLAYESGLNIQARSQWGYVWRRFLRHKLAMASAAVLAVIFLIAIFAPQVAPYRYDEIDLEALYSPPHFETWNLLSPQNHLFGTDLLGRDYFSRVIYGIRTSVWVALVVAGLSTVIGTAIGAIAGYFGGWGDNLLMRITDLFLTLPTLAVLLVAAAYLGQGDPLRVAIILALLFWTPLARIVRGIFLSLREKEYVEAAKALGSRDSRIIIRHMLPNTLGPIIVNATLLIATAILVEAALSFLGFGIQPPTPALGKLIDDGQSEGLKLWWLVTFPGLVIVLIALCINFIGDGLRDALDPTQRRVRA